MKKYLLAVAAMMATMSVNAQDPDGEKLTGTVIGTEMSVDYNTGLQSTTVNTREMAFDGDMETYFASYDRSYTWTGLDLGTTHVITKIGWSPRNDSQGEKRVQLGVFEGANSADFMDAVPLYIIPDKGTIGQMSYATVNCSRAFRYVRYIGPSDARCNIAELEFYGYEGEGDDSHLYQLTNLPTVTIHTENGVIPYDKENEIPSQISIISEDGAHELYAPGGVRLRGNASMSFPKKPYRIKFDKKQNVLDAPAKAKKWTLINNYGDKTLLRNILAFEASRRLGAPYTVYCQAVDVIMNGEYKGCYQLCDHISVDPNRVPITEMEAWDNQEPELTGGYLIEVDAYASGEPCWFNSSRGIPVTIKSPDSEEITTEQKNYIRDYFNLFESAVWSTSFSNEEKGFRHYLDVESFLRHFLVGEFSGNTDTYWSTYMYKDRNQDCFQVAPSWDFDLAFDNDNRIYPVNNHTDWIFRSGGSGAGNMSATVSRILSDPYTARRLKEIWREVRRDGRFTADSWLGYLDSIARDIDASQKLNFIRWPILNQAVHQNVTARGSYEAELQVVRDYLPARIDWIDEYLGGALEPVADTTFYISTPQGLIDFADAVKRGGNGSTAYLEADLDMSGFSEKFSPVGTTSKPFQGTFDGQGHVIRNLHISGGDYTGLFGVVTGGATIQNFTFDSSCSIIGGAFVGIVGGSNGSGVVAISGVGNEADITGSAQNVSGIIGCNMNSSAQFFIENCYNAGNIVGGYESGAISGWTGGSGYIHNCYNIGTVSGTDGQNNYLTRGGATLVDVYSTRGRQGTIIKDDIVTSGQLCYMLSENEGYETQPIWRQNIGEDRHPVLLPGHKQVYYLNNTYTNGGDGMKAGDVNGDGEVNQADLAAMKDFIMGRETGDFIFMLADLNSDNEVNVFDLTRMINLVNAPGVPDEEASGLTNRITINNFRQSAGNTKTVSVLASTSQTFTAFQTDLTFSKGLTPDQESFVMGDLKSDSHVIETGKVNGSIRVLGYAPDNAPLAAFNGNLFTFNLVSAENFTGGTIQLTNQKMSSARGTEWSLRDGSCNVTMATTLVREIILEKDTFQLDPGDHLTLTATVLPATATNKAFTWSVADTEIATITADGMLTGIKNGFTTVTATASDASKKTGTAVVVVGDPSSISLPLEDLKDAEIYTLTGIRVTKPIRGGVYIVNGTKKMIK
jgi:hypothetical protein